MHWNTRNARLARKSLAVTKPAAGLNVNPDDPENNKFRDDLTCFTYCITKWFYLILSRKSYFLRFRKFDTSSICGIQLGPVPHSCIIFSNLTRCILHALPGKSSKTFSQTAPHVAVSSFVYSIYGMGSPLKSERKELSRACFCIYFKG